MFLSGAWIAQNAAPIITPFNQKQIDCSAYTMRVGYEAYVSPEARQATLPQITQLNQKQSITIPPGQFAFLITREFVSIPHDIFAFINIKTGLKVQDLVNVSGFRVDPGYKGHLIFAVFNAGPKALILRENDPAFLIWLAIIDHASVEYSYKKPGYSSITSALASNIPRESASLNSLSSRMDDIEKRLSYLTWGAAVLTAVAVGAVANWLS